MSCFHFRFSQSIRLWLVGASLLSLMAASALAETSCTEGNELDAATRAGIENTANRFRDMSARGDVGSLRAESIPGLASAFGGVDRAVLSNKEGLSGTATISKIFLLNAPGTAPVEMADFPCGVFGPAGNTANSAELFIPNLPPGRYAVVVMDIKGPKGQYTLAQTLQQMGGSWKLAAYTVKSALYAGHDGDWYLQKAREFGQKGQVHNAWFYYLVARYLANPLGFEMSTLKIDKMDHEAAAIRPGDLPLQGPVTANLAGHMYKLLALTPDEDSQDKSHLDLVVRYESADVSNTAQTLLSNTTLMKDLVAKYPELRDGFGAIVARAVAPNGQDYGTLLAMKDIK